MAHSPVWLLRRGVLRGDSAWRRALQVQQFLLWMLNDKANRHASRCRAVLSAGMLLEAAIALGLGPACFVVRDSLL